MGCLPVRSQPGAERARAEAEPVEADTSGIAEDGLRTVVWRGRPVWIVRRSAQTLQSLPKLDSQLSDPGSLHSTQPALCRNEVRSLRPEYFVAIGLCTHLGCSPRLRMSQAEGGSAPGEFYCPCHGSRFDLACQVFRGSPAPVNLVVPPYQYLSDTRMLIGASSG